MTLSRRFVCRQHYDRKLKCILPGLCKPTNTGYLQVRESLISPLRGLANVEKWHSWIKRNHSVWPVTKRRYPKAFAECDYRADHINDAMAGAAVAMICSSLTLCTQDSRLAQ